METATQEIIYQTVALVISGVLAIVGAYARKLISTNIKLSKYGFDNDKLERIQTAKYIFLKATINTAGASDGDYVKFFSYYDIYFKLKLDAALNINTRDL